MIFSLAFFENIHLISLQFPHITTTGGMTVYLAGISFVTNTAATGNICIQFILNIYLHVARPCNTHGTTVGFKICSQYLPRPTYVCFDF